MLITLTDGRRVPVEMHRVKTVQKINLIPAAQRLECMRAVGYNTFLLPSREVFLDMLTDSGTNAMSDNQMAAMMVADDAYAGSESFFKLARVVKRSSVSSTPCRFTRAGPPNTFSSRSSSRRPRSCRRTTTFPTRAHVEIAGVRSWTSWPTRP